MSLAPFTIDGGAYIWQRRLFITNRKQRARMELGIRHSFQRHAPSALCLPARLLCLKVFRILLQNTMSWGPTSQHMNLWQNFILNYKANSEGSLTLGLYFVIVVIFIDVRYLTVVLMLFPHY